MLGWNHFYGKYCEDRKPPSCCSSCILINPPDSCGIGCGALELNKLRCHTCITMRTYDVDRDGNLIQPGSWEGLAIEKSEREMLWLGRLGRS